MTTELKIGDVVVALADGRLREDDGGGPIIAEHPAVRRHIKSSIRDCAVCGCHGIEACNPDGLIVYDCTDVGTVIDGTILCADENGRIVCQDCYDEAQEAARGAE